LTAAYFSEFESNDNMTNEINEDVSAQLQECHDRIAPWIHRTPVLRSTLIDELVGAEVLFKCESFQKGGSYKLRGALNACLMLSPEQRSRGVVTHSSGNFAAAVAIASRQLGMQNFIIVPTNAPQQKIDAARSYGGNIISCQPTLADRQSVASRIVAEQGATLLHPSNDWQVILGQGTCTRELLQEVNDLHVCLCPVGGGGLIAGACLAAESHARSSGKPAPRIMGGEPSEADDAYRSLQSGKIESNATTNTIADGLRSELGDINFPIIQRHVEQIVRVTEAQIIEALKLIWTRLKVVIEPSSAVALAAMLAAPETFHGQRVGVILSGGNIDLANMQVYLAP
jgi:threonine dehydratase